MPKSAPAATYTDFSALPLILTLKEMAAVFRISQLTIRRALQNNTFRPLPFEKYPYRWRKADVIRDLQERRPKLRMRKHGFAKRRGSNELATVG